MGVFLIPFLLIVAIAPTPGPSEKTLANFSRFSKAVGAPIVIVDREGTIREGRLSASTADSVTVAFAGGERVFSQAAVASAERLKDGLKDGFIKGALFGAVVGILAGQGYDSPGAATAGWLGSVAIYGLIGTAIDASQKHREPIYRAAPPAMKVSVRF
ncbi:MAG TPA: hypothetical protein VFP85_12730 [Vicinamibacterales bacterium]|nr:hypothetical protein [Vicinamibacterales bacterium]